VTSRNRKILLVIFIAVSVFGLWARHEYEKRKREKMERTLRSLATHTRLAETRATPAGEPTPSEYVEESRDMFGGELPQESFELVKQAAGPDFKLMSIRVSDMAFTADLTTDGESVSRYQKFKIKRDLEAPQPVRLIGSGKLSDSLFKLSEVNLSLVPQLAKDARERSGLADGKINSVSLGYPLLRAPGEGPEWTVYVERGEGEGREYKNVVFDAKGKFKKVY
jgi:hypothetical protein